jgi:hypothetical protein
MQAYYRVRGPISPRGKNQAMLTAPKVCLLLALTSFTFSLSAQFQSPAVDGVINPGEYAHTSGNWSMTWDETYLYVARTGTEPSILHLDVDPLASATAGSDANGSTTAPGGEDFPAASGLPSFPLPFRSDSRVFVKSGHASLATRDSAGGWSNAGTAADLNDIMFAEGSGREVRIRWQALPGLTGRPASFRWFGSALEGLASATSMTDPVPAANPAGLDAPPYFFSVTSTGDPTATDPFAVRESTWRVTSDQDAGAGTLRAVLDSANADADSTRRYVHFDVDHVSLTTALPNITETVTMDGHTFAGAGSPLRVQISGPGVQFFDVSGMATLDVSNAVFRNLAIDSFEVGLQLTNGSGNVVAGCLFGSAGVSARNTTGLALAGGSATTIGGVAVADRNVFSTNTTAIQLDGTAGTQILGNYIGPYTNGTALNGNSIGIDDLAGASTGLVISGNVISHNVVIGIRLAGSATVSGNLIGVAPDGLTQMANGTGIELAGASDTTIGSMTDPNTIAFNAIGVDGTSGGGVVIRGNVFAQNSTGSIDLTGTVEQTPVVDYAVLDELTIQFSLTPSASTASVRLDLYDSDPATPGIPQPKTLRATQCFNGASFASVTWNVGSGYTTADDLTILATSYSNQGCLTSHTGTSNPTAIFSPIEGAEVTLGVTASPSITMPGQNVTLTATLSSTDSAFSGTVSFTSDGSPISGCTSATVTAGEAQCVTSFASAGSYSIGASYSGDASHATASSTETQVEVVAAIFTGPGSFTDSTKWTGGTMPAAGDSFLILDACTYGNTAPALHYGTVYVGRGATSGSLLFLAGSPGLLRADHIVAAGPATIDMTAGGTLRLDIGTLPAGFAFLRGTGTIVLAGSGQSLPSYELHGLTVSGTVTGTADAVVHGSLAIGAGASLISSADLEMHGPQITNQGTLTLARLQIMSGVTTTLTGNVLAQELINVDGTLQPSATSVLTTDLLNGNGTMIVTGTAAGGSLSAQYQAGFRDLTSLDVKFAGAAAQSVDALTYSNLIMANAAGATVVEGAAVVSGMLTLASGVLVTDDGLGAAGTLSILTPGPTAVVYGAGWIAGNGLGLQFSAGSNAVTFPVGTTTAYFPITLTATLAGPELVRGGIVSFANLADAAGSGIDYARDSNAYYRFETPTASTLGVTLNYGAHADAAASPEFFTMRERQGQWRATQTSVAGNSATATFPIVGEVLYLATGNQLLDRYLVTAAAKQYTGQWFDVAVTAVDELNVRVTETEGPLTMSSSSANVRFDGNADGNFNDSQKALSEGMLTMRTKTSVVETLTITAADGTLNGTSNAINVVLGFAATHLTVTAPVSVAAGTDFNVTVTARRADGSIATGFTGTVRFSGIYEATVPGPYTFTTADAGVHTFTFRISNTGQSTIYAHETEVEGNTSVKVTAQTSIALTTAPNPSTPGQFVSMTAVVTSPYSGNTIGTVTFLIDGVAVKTVEKNGAQGWTYSLYTTTLPYGTHTITAVYNGTPFYAPSTSADVTHVVGPSAFGPPQSLIATALSTSTVEVSWAPVTGAVSFDVYRSTSRISSFVLVGTTTTNSFIDTGRSADTTYLYKARARSSTGTVTQLSLHDPATTVMFTDPTLNQSVPVKAAHVLELRTAINALRIAANASPAGFTALTPDTLLSKLHVMELRSALDSARALLSLPQTVYSDPTINTSTVVKAIHFTQLRNGAS